MEKEKGTRVMKIYLVNQSVNNNYDTYDAMVIVADTKEEAKKYSLIHSSGEYTWAPIEDLNCSYEGVYTGESVKPFLLLASFNAG